MHLLYSRNLQEEENPNAHRKVQTKRDIRRGRLRPISLHEKKRKKEVNRSRVDTYLYVGRFSLYPNSERTNDTPIKIGAFCVVHQGAVINTDADQ